MFVSKSYFDENLSAYLHLINFSSQTCLLEYIKVQMNATEEIRDSPNEQLEDFEEFDLRDAINVAAYSLMSASKILICKFW